MSLNSRHARTLQSLKMAALFGGILGLGFGCIVTLEPIEPCESGSNNKLNDNGECECRIGFVWCDPSDATNLNCCDDGNGSGGTGGDGDGDGGTNSNSNSNTGDGDGDTGDGDGDTGDGDGDGDSGDGDGDGDGDCMTGELPPDTCLPEEEGFSWCTNNEMQGPECSKYFLCMNGVWTESEAAANESCMFDGYDFAYGCVDNGMEVVFDCGSGSGAPCDNATPASCADMDHITYCQYSKETTDSCMDFCMNVGIDGMTYEYGECDDSVPDDVACFCCDSGQMGCPI